MFIACLFFCLTHINSLGKIMLYMCFCYHSAKSKMGIHKLLNKLIIRKEKLER